MLHAYAHLYDYEHSLETIELMVDTGVPPSPESFATATRTCARSGEMGLARYLYALSLSLAIVPNKVCYVCTLSVTLERERPPFYVFEKLSGVCVYDGLLPPHQFMNRKPLLLKNT